MGLPPSDVDAAYANDWPGLVAPPVDVWMYGHTHAAIRHQIASGVLLASNPLGYSHGDDTEFDPAFLLEV